ncbi:MFS transporter [Oceanicella sp. SM1341]|uniref:MFS transporter n=1 Tax=Oceanicella sp. SM1341 TaxID=1548889 RepID=UPI000E5191A8|nr:MFS transporter [Oceanicella sp. SM1341]
MNRVIPIVLSVALFMENMDSTILSTALPTIAADIGTNPIALKLALTSYYVALAIFIPISGRLADRIGPRKVFRAALGVFMLGSLACAFAGSLEGFVAARFLQGMGGAMMTPVGRLLLVRSVPKAELVTAMAWFTIPALIGPLVGPPVGGAIATWAHWQWIFLINLPIGAIGIVLATLYLPKVERMENITFDWTGFLLSGLACAGIVFGSSVISLPVLPPVVGIALMAGGVLAVLAYLRHARRVEAPLLRLSMIRAPVFGVALRAGFLFRIGTGAVPFLMPLLLQLGFNFSPFVSGVITCMGIGGAIAMKFLARPILRALGFRQTLILAALLGGLLIAPLGFYRPELSVALLVAMLLGGGFFRSLFFTGVNALAFSDLDEKRSGDGTALMSVSQQLSIALAVAIAGAVLEVCMVLAGRDVPAVGDFTVAFLLIGVITASASAQFLALEPDAGAEVSGHRAG